MKRSLILSSLLLCAIWVVAQTQTYPNQNSPSSPQTSTQTNSTDNQRSVRGCLSGSNGNYTLTDESGTTYQLAGDTSKLSDHVGHKVEIKGTTTPSSATSSGTSGTSSSSGASGTSNTTSAQRTLNVSSIKHISSTCNTSH